MNTPGDGFAIWIGPLADPVLRGAGLGIAALLWVVCLVRLVGLRSLSKMTSFDFVVTLATGSLVATASQATGWGAYLQALAAIAGLFAVQYGAARLRRDWQFMARHLHNEPILLLRDGRFIDEALAATRVTRADVLEKLRMSNAKRIDDVHAVVLESTGDVSVLHGDDFDPAMLEDVRGYARE